MSQAHNIDERSTQECRTQIEMIETLEHRLSRERGRLQAMMQHLQMKHSPDSTQPNLGKVQPQQQQPQVQQPLQHQQYNHPTVAQELSGVSSTKQFPTHSLYIPHATVSEPSSSLEVKMN